MGNDGHTASIFPKAPQFQTAIDGSAGVALVHTTPVTAPHERISMTLDAIAHTGHVFLAIQGEEKKPCSTKPHKAKTANIRSASF
ncbi:6-phosphogluconolactonase [Neisseria gonorrhoeae]|uniref:6-phosphogluconolactonase n=1 Tax=Neisseria gonorrhoeae TaxID=485 RepID=A0A378VZN6_NEIGO|nr:6-phosphogluconolactonase [Neisseria gonorrhoeae]